MKKRNWSFDELNFIKENYDRLTLDELSKILQCSKSTLTYTIKNLLKLGRKPLVRKEKIRRKK